MQSPAIRRAIISVSDKSGLADLARGLVQAGVQIYSTGGTRKHLEDAGLTVIDVGDYTGFPEMMDGRLKTLHPKIHGGVLCRHDHPQDLADLKQHGIEPFELVVVNLYPFEATVARSGVTFDQAIEQIDIGGPSLVRGASKNHAFTTIATGPEQYPRILEQIQSSGSTTPELRRELAAAAFALTARYDRAIAEYFDRQQSLQSTPHATSSFPTTISLRLARREELRYGENPHQPAALYALEGDQRVSLVAARKLNGKELSYNNLLDLHSALAIVRGLAGAAVSVVKHNNPCGAGTADSLARATRLALEGDPVSAFGSVLGFNRPVDAATAEVLVEPGRFVEAAVAPSFDDDALAILTTRPKWKDNVRLLALGDLEPASPALELRAIEGGYLAQEPDVLPDVEQDWQVVSERQPSTEQMANLRFAWALVRHVKSNAIVLASDESLVGVGAGQMSRVDSVEIALRKAGTRAKGSALGSDAFFPFADSIELAAAAGVAAIIQPGGSRRDEEVIAACNRHGIAMIFTHRRHFKH